MYNDLLESAKRELTLQREQYRYLHSRPEVGLSLSGTVEFVSEKLREAGLETVEQLCGGVVATVGEGEESILLRADMDALDIREETDLEFASKNGAMHACGHDMHTAMLLSAARLLKEREGELSGRVVLCFQPGEETLSGAKKMLEAGLIEKTGATKAVMLHALTATDFPAGTVIIPPSGVGAAGADFFRIDVLGKGCHGSTPYLGKDPILALAAMISALSSLTSREVDSQSGAALTLGMIRGGSSSNVIPERACAFGTLRSYDDGERELLRERLVGICAHIGKALRCEGGVEFTSGAPSFLNDMALREMAIKALDREGIPTYLVPEGKKGGGSEDFAYVSRKIPSLMLCISAGERKKGFNEPLHSPRAVFDEAALPFGAAAYAAVALCSLFGDTTM
ncbi:MAG: amidohydrolase [Clostridia bacterium]|nr:amidohydrolase [Clostridia bacterium]